MTNNPDKFGGLEGFGLDITERVGAAELADRAQHRLPAHEARPDGPPPGGTRWRRRMRRRSTTTELERLAARGRRRRSRATATGAGCASGSPARGSTGGSRRGCSRAASTSSPSSASTPPTSPSRGCPAPSSCRSCARAFATAEAGYDAVVAPRRGHPRRDRPLRRRRRRVRAGHPGGGRRHGQARRSSACSPASTVGQALERSAPDETNKGREAARAAVEMARLLERPAAAVRASTRAGGRDRGRRRRSTRARASAASPSTTASVVGFHATQLADGTRTHRGRRAASRARSCRGTLGRMRGDRRHRRVTGPARGDRAAPPASLRCVLTKRSCLARLPPGHRDRGATGTDATRAAPPQRATHDGWP